MAHGEGRLGFRAGKWARRSSRSLAVIAALLLAPRGLHAEPSELTAHPGDTYEVSIDRKSSSRSSDGSSGSTQDRDTLTERVIQVRSDGVELEYDLPPAATAQDRARTWQFPVRVFKPSDGPMQLLNGPELEARVDRWLELAELTRAACGRWIFTWNAFRIECDPQSVVETLRPYDLHVGDLRDGGMYHRPGARGSAPLVKKTAEPEGATFSVELQIDADAVRRERAEADVAVAELTNKPLSLEAALAERAKEAVAGTIAVTLQTDPAGSVRRRTTVTQVEITGPDGRSETSTITETVERRLVGVTVQQRP